MMLEEAQARLKKEKITTQDEIWAINSLYILLDLHKDDFCKIIDAVGLEKLISKRAHYERLYRAEQELKAREEYERNVERLEELRREKEMLTSKIEHYRKYCA